MNDLKLFHSLHTEIAQLKDELTSAYLLIEEQKRIIKLREKSINAHIAENRLLRGEHELPTDKARKIIKQVKSVGFTGSISNQCKVIAVEVGLTTDYIRVLWYEKTHL